jgi:hypothetical protein
VEPCYAPFNTMNHPDIHHSTQFTPRKCTQSIQGLSPCNWWKVCVHWLGD